MDAARRRFAREGYAGAGMEAVAKDAGVSTATLYSYFPGKADLFRAVLMEATGTFSDQLMRVESKDGSVRGRLLAISVAYARFWSDPYRRAMFRLMIGERHRFEPVADQFYEAARRTSADTLIRMLSRMQKAGELKVDDVASAAGQLMGMLEHPTLVFGLVTGDGAKTRRSAEEIGADAVETFLARYALRVEAGAGPGRVRSGAPKKQPVVKPKRSVAPELDSGRRQSPT